MFLSFMVLMHVLGVFRGQIFGKSHLKKHIFSPGMILTLLMTAVTLLRSTQLPGRVLIRNHMDLCMKWQVPYIANRCKCECKCLCLPVLPPVTDCWPVQRISCLLPSACRDRLQPPTTLKGISSLENGWLDGSFWYIFSPCSLPFSIMSLLAISVQRMLFQFRVNQGENENLTGLYYLYTETLLYSCCDQQLALIMHTHKHAHAKTNSRIFCIHMLLDILYREDSLLYSYHSIFLP